MPRIWWKVECYHYETVIEHYTERDSNGNTHHKTRTRREKRVTHRATGHYMFRQWRDVSPALTGLCT